MGLTAAMTDDGVQAGRGAAGSLRSCGAALALLVIYAGLSLLCSPSGFLGTDTGGKVATVKMMSERGDFDPDVGYWAAEWDPDATVHGLYYTSHVGDRYTNVTSLPMVLAARPLYDLGGYRATLLLPMAGAILAAFAARALAERLKQGRGWPAFWIVGLASPLVIYALDLWEHSLGVACMAWAVVAVFDAVERRTTWWQGLAAGLLFGAAASMRTEAFVYVAITLAVACGALVLDQRRRIGDALLVGATAVAGFAVAFGANTLLERAVLGEASRTSRTSGAASNALGRIPDRINEGFVTTLSPFPSTAAEYWFIGLGLLVALVAVAWYSKTQAGERIAVTAAAVAAAVYLWRFSDGLGFVPGLVATTPFAAVGITLGWKHARARLVLLFAVVPLPFVFGFQFLGGAAPQWAGRYILQSGFLLLVVGVALAGSMAAWARTYFVVLSVAVTLFGVGWLAVRSHQISDAIDRFESRGTSVLISPQGFVPREFGATYPDQKWLASGNEEDLAFAVDVVGESGQSDFAIVDLNTERDIRQFEGWDEVDSEVVEFIGGAPVRITTYERAPAS